ncbi:MAG: hypothetical protein J7K48_05020 [Thermococcus sp.]|nr:hypothetical protein [Thermococcus sp.]
MKKVLILGLVTVFGFVMVGFAAPTVLNTTWDFYGGGFNINFNSGDDASVTFNTAGAHAWGSFSGTDYDNNPYNYNVDNTRAQVTANVDGGGGIYFRMERQGSWVSMYGVAGQYTETDIWTSDGTAFFASNTRTNYADMITHNYGYKSAEQYQASGTNFRIWHEISGAADRFANVEVFGSGSAIVTLMSDEARASGFRFGEGAGCYTAARANGTGTGYFGLFATAPNDLQIPFGSVTGGGTFSYQLWYNAGFSVDPINMSGH